jgi:hypothetical protein
MRDYRRFSGAALLLGVLGRLTIAQQPTIPIRPLGAVIAVSSDTLTDPAIVRVLSDGRVLVNDPVKQRLILLDSALQHSVIVADTTAGTKKAYGNGLFGLVAFRGDSSLTRDQITGSFVVIDGAGKISRVIPQPRTANAAFSGATVGSPPLAFDQAGHLFFRAPSTVFLAQLDQDFVGDTLMKGPDSVAVLRQDLSTGRIDTIAMVQAPRTRQAVTRRGPGLGGSGRPAFNPLPSADDWTVMQDGTLAVVRVRDYHVDWVQPDKRVTSGPKVPAEWTRITDSMKVAMIAGARTRDSVAAAARGGANPSAPQRAYVEPSDLPDVRPPFINGWARADSQANVWVRLFLATPFVGGPVYDVINRQGVVIDRVRLPAGTALAGFSPDMAYLITHDGGVVRLAKARIR